MRNFGASLDGVLTQVVTFDHRGVGASEGQPPYKVEQWAADTLRLIDHLGLDRMHLVGHSTGGTIVQVLAADHSDRAASLVLGATWARLDARLRRLFMFRKQATSTGVEPLRLHDRG